MLTNDNVSLNSLLLQQFVVVQLAIHNADIWEFSFDLFVLGGVAHQDSKGEFRVFMVQGIQGVAANVACGASAMKEVSQSKS